MHAIQETTRTIGNVCSNTTVIINDIRRHKGTKGIPQTVKAMQARYDSVPMNIMCESKEIMGTIHHTQLRQMLQMERTVQSIRQQYYVDKHRKLYEL